MKTPGIFTLSFLSILFFFPSCSKKSSQPPACKIISVKDGPGGGAASNETYTFAYDKEGRISLFNDDYGSNTYTLAYAYSGNTVLVTSTSPGAATVTDSIVLNSDGLPVSDLQRNGSDSNLLTYTYSGTEIQKYTLKENNGLAVTGSTYTYTNGDLTSVTNADGVTTYTYDTSKPSVPGDYFQITGLTDGWIPTIRCAHLVTSISFKNSVSNLNYVFDNKGNITGLDISSSTGVEHMDYTYQCN